MKIISLALFSLCIQASLLADEFKVAVAANFKDTLWQLRTDFQQQSKHRFHISSGSSGILYAQILAGAPFDVFMSADVDRPTRLLKQRLAKKTFVYAIGQLVLWVPDSKQAISESWLKSFTGKLAIANPVTAPYGTAAIEVITQLGIADQLSLVKGNNVAQAYQFVETAGAEAGFVSCSLLENHCVSCINSPNCMRIPQTLYQPIRQQAALLTGSNPGAVDFFTYLQSSRAQRIISSMGYSLERQN